MKININKIKEIFKNNKGYQLRRIKKYRHDELAKDWDKVGYMSEEIGKEIEHLFEDKNYIIALHRSKLQNEEKIFEEGIKNNSLMFQASKDTLPDFWYTASRMTNEVLMNASLKTLQDYKGSNGGYIIKIPKSYLGEDEGDIKPIYRKTNEMYHLLPEFIYGYIPVEKDVITKFIHNPNYQDIHTYNNDELIYDDSVSNKIRKDHISKR